MLTLLFNKTIMFLMQLIKALAGYQQWFSGKPTLANLTGFPMTTIEDRFMFLIQLATYANSLKISVIGDGKELVPNLQKINKILIQSNSMSHNTEVVAFAFLQIMQELSFEIIEQTNNKGDMSLIPDIYNGAIPASAFLDIPETTTFFNKIYSYNGKSGTNYSGTGITGLTAYNTEQLKDIIEGLNLEEESDLIRNYILSNEEEMKSQFKNFRMALLPFLKWHLDPESQDSKIVEYVRSKLLDTDTSEEVTGSKTEKSLTKKEIKAIKKQKKA